MPTIKEVVNSLPAENHEDLGSHTGKYSYGFYSLVCMIASSVLMMAVIYLRFSPSGSSWAWIPLILLLSFSAYMASFVYRGAEIASKANGDGFKTITLTISIVYPILTIFLLLFAQLLGI